MDLSEKIKSNPSETQRRLYVRLMGTTITVRTALNSSAELHSLALRPEVFQRKLSQQIPSVFTVAVCGYHGCIITIYKCM